MSIIATHLPASTANEVPQQAQRGVVLYVNLDESSAPGTSLIELAEALQQYVAQIAPGADSYAALTLATDGDGASAAVKSVLANNPTLQGKRPLLSAVPKPAEQAPAAAAPRPLYAAPAAAEPARRTGLRSRRYAQAAPESPARRDHLNRLRATHQDQGFLVNPGANAGGVTHVAPPTHGLFIDSSARSVTINGNAVSLTYKEFELLTYLARNARRVVTRDELMNHVWATPSGDESGERTVDVHIRRVRNKLSHAYRNVITTVRGVGYRFDPTPEVRFSDTRSF